MGQFKDLIVSGDARVIGDIYGNLKGTADNAVSINGFKVNADVPANAVFTDTKYTAGSGISISGTTISLSGGATMYDNNLNWGGPSLAGKISPTDAGCIDEFGHNKLAFLPPECVTVEYTTDGGETWIDYGLSDSAKANLTTLAGQTCYIGKNIANVTNGLLTADNCTQYQLRVTLCSRKTDRTTQALYTQPTKILLNISTGGATGSHVIIERRSIADYNNEVDNWIKLGDYALSGWAGWNSIPYNLTFGGGAHQTTNPAAELRFTFGITGINPAYACALSLQDMRMIGITNWATPSELSRSGRLYKINANQGALFPANVFPETTNTAYLGTDDKRWRGIYGTNFYANGFVQIGKTNLDEAKLKKLLALIE